MADIPSNLQKIQIEQAKYRAGVSESVMTYVGSSVNAMIDQNAGFQSQINNNASDISDNATDISEVFASLSFGVIKSTITGAGTKLYTCNFKAPYALTVKGISISMYNSMTATTASNSFSFIDINSSQLSAQIRNNTTASNGTVEQVASAQVTSDGASYQGVYDTVATFTDAVLPADGVMTVTIEHETSVANSSDEGDINVNLSALVSRV